MKRPQIVALAALAMGTLLGDKGCDSNYIGVQDYGTVIGNVVDQAGKPISNALVRVTGSTGTSSTDPKGGFYLQHVAVGEQTVTAYAAGYNGSATCDAIVAKDKTASCGNMSLLSTTAPQGLQQQTPAPTPTSSGN
jgi:hypothetical protein